MEDLRRKYRTIGSVLPYSAGTLLDPVDGLPASMQFIYGSFYGDGGRHYFPIRGIIGERARPLAVAVAQHGGDFIRDIDASSSGTVVTHTGPGLERTCEDVNLTLNASGRTLHWTDGGSIDIAGEVVQDSCRFQVPSGDCPFAYTFTSFRTTAATIREQRVHGLIFVDTLNFKEGMTFLESPYYTELQAAWVAFATRFDDGAIHFGHLLYGHAGFQLLLIQRTDGPPIICSDFNVSMQLDDSGEYAQQVRFAPNDGSPAWEWSASPGSRMPRRPDLKADYRSRQGIVRSVDEKRKTRFADGLMELYLDRLPSQPGEQ
jgi:hypothetical protein